MRWRARTGGEDHGDEQVTHFVAGQRVCGAGAGGDGDEGVRQHGQQDPGTSGDPAPGLVFVEVGQALACPDGFFDGPATNGDPDQLDDRDTGRCPGSSPSAAPTIGVRPTGKVAPAFLGGAGLG